MLLYLVPTGPRIFRSDVVHASVGTDHLTTISDNLTFENSVTTVISCIGIGLAVISVALRFYIRLRIKAGIGWDDWWILIGLLMSCLTIALLFWGALVQLPCSIHFR